MPAGDCGLHRDRLQIQVQHRRHCPGLQAVEGSYFIKKTLEEAGIPVLAFHADPVNPKKWNAETMTGLVEEFIEQRVIPNKEKKQQNQD